MSTSGPVTAKYLPRHASDPNGVRVGQLYFNTVSETVRVCLVPGEPGTWADVGGGAVETTGEQLLSTTVVDVNTLDVQDLYTVPAEKILVVTRIVAREPSTELTTHPDDLTIIDSVGGIEFTVITLNSLSHLLTYINNTPGAARTVAAAGKVQATLTFDVFGSAATVKVDLFGYLLDA
jgi:hypothetical protein